MKKSIVDLQTLNWHWKTFETMSAREFHDIAKLRQQVFIVEQACLFSDLDDLDPITQHLMATHENELIAYARVLAPHKPKDPVYISRICTDINHRKHGVGHELMKKALEYIQQHYPNKEVVISAQSYLEKFYNKFDFKRIGKPYLEDGIPHIAMHRHPRA